MKIKKIVDKLVLLKDEGVELQGCLSDCAQYKMKTKNDYNRIKKQGYKADGSENSREIKEIKEAFGVYCYKSMSAKTCIFW